MNVTEEWRLPEQMLAGEKQEIICRLVLPEALAAGSRLVIMGGQFRTFREGWALNSATLDGEPSGLKVLRIPPSEFRHMHPARMAAAYEFHAYAILEIECAEATTSGACVEIILDAIPFRFAPLRGWLQAEVRDADEKPLWSGERRSFCTVAQKPVNLECRVQTTPNARGKHRLCVFAVDRYLNIVTGLSDKIKVQSPEGLWLTEGRLNSETGVFTSEIDSALVSEPMRLHASCERLAHTAASNWLIPENYFKLKPVFGDLHIHTDFSSDGDRTIEEAYTYARDVLCLDMACVTDHSPVAGWEQTVKLNEDWNDPGNFVTLHAWEWSTSDGHANFYLRTAEQEDVPLRTKDFDHPARAAWSEDCIMIPHHTNMQAEALNDEGKPSWRKYDWSIFNDRIGLMEIVQTRGNFEYDEQDKQWGIWESGCGASLDDALRMGYRLGIVGGTDNHVAFPTRDMMRPGNYIGMTGCWVNERSRESIWQSLNTRQCYATSGKPLILWMEVNGQPMGSAHLPASPSIEVTLKAPIDEKIQRLPRLVLRKTLWPLHPLGALRH